MSLPTNSPMTRVPDDYCPPGGARHFTLGEGPDAGKTLFYYDVTVGEGTPRTTVLMVHGNPECSYTYRHVRDHLIASGTRAASSRWTTSVSGARIRPASRWWTCTTPPT